MSALNPDGTLDDSVERISVLLCRKGNDRFTVVGIVCIIPRPSLDDVVADLAECPGQHYEVVMVGATSVFVEI